MVPSGDPRARLLRAALGFLSLEPSEPELQLLHRCFDNWRGIGDVVAGAPGVRPRAPAIRRPGLARDLLSKRFRALAHVTCRRGVGAQPVGGSAASGRGCATQARSRGCPAARLDSDGRVAKMTEDEKGEGEYPRPVWPAYLFVAVLLRGALTDLARRRSAGGRRGRRRASP